MEINMKEALKPCIYAGKSDLHQYLEIDSKGNLSYKKPNSNKLDTMKNLYPNYFIGEVKSCCSYAGTYGVFLKSFYCKYSLLLATSSEERFNSICKGERVDLPPEEKFDVYFIMMNVGDSEVKSTEGFVFSEDREKPLVEYTDLELEEYKKKVSKSDLNIDYLLDKNFKVISESLEYVYNKGEQV